MEYDIICQSDLFAEVNKEYVKSLLNSSRRITFKKGDLIVRQGEQGNSMFFILYGFVRIIISIFTTNGEETTREIARMGPGAYFGEICVLTTPQPRSATVYADSDMQVVELPAEKFLQDVEKKQPEALQIAYNIAVILTHRLRKGNLLILQLQKKFSQASTVSELELCREKLLKEAFLN